MEICACALYQCSKMLSQHIPKCSGMAVRYTWSTHFTELDQRSLFCVQQRPPPSLTVPSMCTLWSRLMNSQHTGGKMCRLHDLHWCWHQVCFQKRLVMLHFSYWGSQIVLTENGNFLSPSYTKIRVRVFLQLKMLFMSVAVCPLVHIP